MAILRTNVLLTRLNSWLHREVARRSPRGSHKRARALARYAGAIARKVDAQRALDNARAWAILRKRWAEQVESEEV